MKKQIKLKKYDGGGTARQPFTFPYTPEEIAQIQGQQNPNGQQAQPVPQSNPYNDEIAKLPTYMQQGMYAGVEKMQNPEMVSLNSAPIKPLDNPKPVSPPLQLNTQPITGLGLGAPAEAGSTKGKVQAANSLVKDIAGSAGQIFSGVYAAIPALTSLIPDKRTRPLRPEMEQAYTQNMYGQGDTNLYAEGGMLGFHKQSRKTNGFEVTEELPDVPINNIDYTATPAPTLTQPIPYPVPINPKKITYEHLHTGNDANKMDVYSPVFNGNWSAGDMKNAFTNGTIPSNYNGVPTVNYSNYQDLWNGNAPNSSSYNMIPSSGANVPRNNMIDITSNMGKNSPYNYQYFNNGGVLQSGQEVELNSAQIAHYKALGYKFK